MCFCFRGTKFCEKNNDAGRKFALNSDRIDPVLSAQTSDSRVSLAFLRRLSAFKSSNLVVGSPRHCIFKLLETFFTLQCGHPRGAESPLVHCFKPVFKVIGVKQRSKRGESFDERTNYFAPSRPSPDPANSAGASRIISSLREEKPPKQQHKAQEGKERILHGKNLPLHWTINGVCSRPPVPFRSQVVDTSSDRATIELSSRYLCRKRIRHKLCPQDASLGYLWPFCFESNRFWA